jgi:hypothetical protein
VADPVLGGKRSVVGGPFAEAKELIAGYTLVQVDSREEAQEWARRFPAPFGENAEGEIEVRPGTKARRFPPSGGCRPLRGDEDLQRELIPTLSRWRSAACIRYWTWYLNAERRMRPCTEHRTGYARERRLPAGPLHGSNTQLVLMTLAPGEDIGRETHDGTTSSSVSSPASGSSSSTVRRARWWTAPSYPCGVEHNLTNTSDDEPLRLYTLYSREHPDGTVHRTKKEAEAPSVAEGEIARQRDLISGPRRR